MTAAVAIRPITILDLFVALVIDRLVIVLLALFALFVVTFIRCFAIFDFFKTIPKFRTPVFFTITLPTPLITFPVLHASFNFTRALPIDYLQPIFAFFAFFDFSLRFLAIRHLYRRTLPAFDRRVKQRLTLHTLVFPVVVFFTKFDLQIAPFGLRHKIVFFANGAVSAIFDEIFTIWVFGF
jgi:hypothetical protein